MGALDSTASLVRLVGVTMGEDWDEDGLGRYRVEPPGPLVRALIMLAVTLLLLGMVVTYGRGFLWGLF